jgi:hypothetical protein
MLIYWTVAFIGAAALTGLDVAIHAAAGWVIFMVLMCVFLLVMAIMEHHR